MFGRYEKALLARDVDTIVGLFDEAMHRFGIDDEQSDRDSLRRWWADGPGVSPGRVLHGTRVAAITADVVVTTTRFADGDGPASGRQTQVWARRPAGWRIVEAHVSHDASA